MKSMIAVLAAMLAVTACGDAKPTVAREERPVTVFAAASLTDVLEAIGDLYAADGHPVPRFNFAASSALARQMEQGAEADVFISADEDWMDYVADKSLIEPASRTLLLTNELVLVAPASAPFALAMADGMDLVGALKGGKLALADPNSVPAGKYAREALTHFGAWAAVESSVARAENVRAALRFVETGDAAAGIVYATDARAAGDALMAIGVFPPESHTPIVYPAALIAGRADGPGKAFLTFLGSEAAEAVFREAGFGLGP
jgi:molybdate transport system substrate-binding protein